MPTFPPGIVLNTGDTEIRLSVPENSSIVVNGLTGKWIIIITCDKPQNRGK